MKLSGYICASDVIRLDYCLELAARSLMPVVDELILCDRQSTDETPELMQRLATEHPNVRILNYPDPIPKVAQDGWMQQWLNWTRGFCSHEMQIQLDADEVLGDSLGCWDAVLTAQNTGGCRWFNRINFWKDAYHQIPDGFVCGRRVARMGPTKFWMPIDEPVGDFPIRTLATDDLSLQIFHYGFIRKQEPFWDKCEVCHPPFFGEVDPRVRVARAAGQKVEEAEWGFSHKVDSWTGTHPAIAIPWLKERGRI